MQLRWLDNLRQLVLRLKDHLLRVFLLLVIDEFLLIILLVLHVHLLLEIVIVTKESFSLLPEIDALPLYLLEVFLQVTDSLLQVGNLASETQDSGIPVSYTHLRAHETDSYLVCRLLLEKKKKT